LSQEHESFWLLCGCVGDGRLIKITLTSVLWAMGPLRVALAAEYKP